MENDRAATALADIASARAAAAERLTTPSWYHPVLGVWVGGYIVAVGLGDSFARALAVAVFTIGVAVLVNTYRRATGVWISGLSAGRASRWAIATGIVAGLGILVPFVVTMLDGPTWPTFVAAPVAAIAVVALGRRFDVALREQLDRA